ncbi:MAG: hypothetical protein R3F21_08980 [Myxococcota bacterium]
MKPTVSETSTRVAVSGFMTRTVVRGVAKSLSSTSTPLPWRPHPGRFAGVRITDQRDGMDVLAPPSPASGLLLDRRRLLAQLLRSGRAHAAVELARRFAGAAAADPAALPIAPAAGLAQARRHVPSRAISTCRRLPAARMPLEKIARIAPPFGPSTSTPVARFEIARLRV